MNVKERGSDLWRAWPALHRALPLLLGSDQPSQKIITSRSTKPTSVRAMEYDKPRPWRYVRWRKANERQLQPMLKEQDERRPKGNYVYKVLPDEDLASIAINHDTFIEVIMEANKTLNPANIATGQLLWIPRTHLIKRGNTLWSLSRKYGVSIPSIQKANGIEDPNLIFAGDILRIPHEVQV